MSLFSENKSGLTLFMKWNKICSPEYCHLTLILPVMTFVICSLIFLASLYFKQYRPRSDCSRKQSDLGYPRKKYLGGGGGVAADIFFYGWLVRKDFKLYGHWCPTKSNYMGGWYLAAWKGKKEYYLPKKERSFIKSSQKKALKRKRPFLFTGNCQTSDGPVEYW